MPEQTLAALIVVLGIVVDDPIVVIDNHVEKLDHGMSVWDAAKSSAQELFPSVFTATLAISAIFVPLAFFMTGVSKDFIRLLREKGRLIDFFEQRLLKSKKRLRG